MCSGPFSVLMKRIHKIYMPCSRGIALWLGTQWSLFHNRQTFSLLSLWPVAKTEPHQEGVYYTSACSQPQHSAQDLSETGGEEMNKDPPEIGGCQQKRGGNTFQRMQIKKWEVEESWRIVGVRKKEEHSRKWGWKGGWKTRRLRWVHPKNWITEALHHPTLKRSLLRENYLK